MSTPKSILVAVDFEAASLAALRHTSELALCCGAKVHGVHALHLPAVQNVAAVPLAIQLEAEKAAQRRLMAATARVANLGQLVVRTGAPDDVILEAAAKLGADMIVVGHHNRRGVQRWLVGSVADSVARRSPCSVLVYAERASQSPSAK